MLFLAGIGVLASIAVAGCGSGTRPPARFITKRVMHIAGSEGEEAGWTIAAGGDVNGDGIKDAVIGALQTYVGGAVYVVFGSRAPLNARLAALGPHGFEIKGKDDLNSIGESVASVGDFDGDGLGDVLVGVGGQPTEGFLVFGRRRTSAIRLASPGTSAVRIPGAFGGFAAGDLNGDGLADVVLDMEPALRVVFGARNRRVDKGFDIRPAGCCLVALEGRKGVVGIGDVNGDGRDDLAVLSAPEKTHLASQSVTASILFGKSDTATIDLAAIGARGFQVKIPFSTRDTVAPAGDVNGDGLADFVLSAPFDKAGAGSVYVIFGNKHPQQVNVANLGGAGFEIEGAGTFDELGTFVGSAADLNNDGVADLVIGEGDGESGPFWVVYGARGVRNLRIDQLGDRGFRVPIPKTLDPVTIATGDVTGDGRAEVLVGDPSAGPKYSESGTVDVYAFKRVP